MANKNVLVQREFDIDLNGQRHKIKVTAVFTIRDVLQDTGDYFLSFMLDGEFAELVQPNKVEYSRMEAKKAAELAFNSGEVEALARSKFRVWLDHPNFASNKTRQDSSDAF